MADDLSDQLALTQKLAAQVERLAAAAEKVEASYGNQIAAVEKLAQAYSQISTQNVVQNVETLNKTLRDNAQNMKDTGKVTESTFTRLSKKIEETGRTISTKFPKSVAIAVAAMTGFEQGIRNVISLGKGVTGFITSFVDGLVNITASIIAIPFKMFQGLFDMAVKSAGGSNELAEAIEKLRKQFGELYGPTNKAIIDTAKNLKGFSDTGLSAFKVFGNLAQRLNDIRELATEMGVQFGMVRKEFEDNGGALLAYQKGLGLSAETMGALSAKATVAGKSFSGMLKDITKFSLAMADSSLDAKQLSRDMGKMAKDVKHFGQLGARELSEVAVYARKLGIEVEKMTSTLDAFESFDTAAENAAQLSQAFGANIDAFKLMEAQNPAEQFDMLRKAMFAAGKTSENMTRQELKLLASRTGMDEETAQRAFAMKNQGMSLDMIKKKSGEAEKKTLTQAEAMNKLADAIERMTPQGGGMNFTSFWDAFIKGFLGGIQQSKEFREIMLNIQQSLRIVYMEGVRLGRAFVEMFPGVKDFLQGIADFFQPQKFKKLVGGVVDILKDWMKDLQNPDGKASFAGLMDKLKEKFFDFFDSQSASGQKLIGGFKTVMKTVTKILAEGIKWAAEKLGEGVQFAIDLLTGKKKIGVPGGAAGELGFLGEILLPLGDALAHSYTILKPKILELVKHLGKMLFDFLKSDDFLNMVKPAIPYLAAILFGPALGRAILGALTTTLFKSVGGFFSGGGAKKAIEMIAGKTKDVAAQASKVAEKTGGGAGEGLKATEEVGKAADGAIKSTKDWGVQDAVKLGLKLVAIATALAIGGVEMAIAVSLMKAALAKGGINKPEDAYTSLMVLAATILAVAPVAFASKALEQANWKSMFKLVPIAAAVGLAGVAMAGAISLMNTVLKAGGVSSPKAAEAPLLVLGAMIVAMVPAVIGMKIVSSAAAPSEVLKGGLVIAAAAAIVGVTGAILGGLLSLINPAKLEAAGKFMLNMSLVFLAMVPLIIAAMAIGALASGPQAIALAAAAVGMVVIGAAVASMAGIAVGIVQVLAKLPIDETFQPKVDAFLGIMKAIQALTDSMVKIIGMLMPGVMDLLTFTPVTKKIESARKFIVDLIGGPDAGGILGIINVVMGVVNKISGMGAGFGEAANTFASIMTATAELMKAMTPPPEFFETQTSFINVVAPWTGMNVGKRTAEFMGAMSENLGLIIPGIIDAVQIMGGVRIPNVEEAKVVASLISAIATLTKALTPDAKAIEAMNESSAGVSYAWGLFKAKGESKTGDQLKSIMMGQAEAANKAVEAITQGPVKNAINAVAGLSKDQIEGVKTLSDMMGMVTNLINAIGQNLKSTVTEKIDGSKAERTWSSVPDVVTVLKGIATHMPELMSAMTKAVASVPTDKGFLAHLDAAKGLFAMFGEIPKLSKSLADASKGAGGGGDIKNIEPLMDAVNAIKTFLGRLISDFGVSPIGMIIDNIKKLGALGLDKAGSGLTTTVNSLTGMFKGLGELAGSFKTAAGIQFDKSMTDGVMKLVTGIDTTLSQSTPTLAKIETTATQLKNTKDTVAKMADFGTLVTGLIDVSRATAKITASPEVTNLAPESAAAGIKKVANFMAQLSTDKGDLSVISTASSNMQKYANAMKNGGIIPALDAVTKMVDAANKLNTALADANLNKIDVKAKLGQVASAVGLGGKASYTVNPSKEVVITVNMTVTMNAGEVERVILQREGSVLRDRINFATSQPDAKTSSEIPNSPNVPTPRAVNAGTK